MPTETSQTILCVKSILTIEDMKTRDKLWEKFKDRKYLSKYEEKIIDLIEEERKDIGHLPSLETICSKSNGLANDNQKVLSLNSLKDLLDRIKRDDEIINIQRFFSEAAKQVGEDRYITAETERKVNDILAAKFENSYIDPLPYLEQGYKNKDHVGGMSLCDELLDKDSGGLRKGNIVTLFGYTGSCKTMYATNIAYLAAKQGNNVAYVTLEISADHMGYNLLSRYSNEINPKNHKIPHIYLKKQNLDEASEKYVFKELFPDFYNKIGKHIKIIDENNFKTYSAKSFTQIFKEVDMQFSESTGHGIDLIIIDHVQLLKHRNDNKIAKDGREVINALVSYFRKQSLNFLNTGRQVCFLLISQANRSGWEEADSGIRVSKLGEDGKYHYKKEGIGTYDLTALAEANELERSSSLVLSIYTNELYLADNTVLVMILKNRNGKTYDEPILICADPEYYTIGETLQFEDSSNVGIDSIVSTVDNDNSLLKSQLERMGELDTSNSKFEPDWDD